MSKMELTQGQFAIVCACHIHLVDKYKWYALYDPHSHCFRVVRHDKGEDGKPKNIWMHRVINNTPDHLRTDHINGNPLDNRCCNLRNATASQNMMNRKRNLNNKSGYKGVSWKKDINKWVAVIYANGKRIFLGNFESPIDAASAYNAAAKKYHKDYAAINPLT